MPRGIGNGVDTYADSTLMTFSKKELINIIRMLEANVRNANEVNDRQYKLLLLAEKKIEKYEEICECEEIDKFIDDLMMLTL